MKKIKGFPQGTYNKIDGINTYEKNRQHNIMLFEAKWSFKLSWFY